METFTEQLRRIDDADLDPYQFRLIMHYWRVGTCWETLRTTAEKCGISLAKVHGTQKWLLDNGWIEYQPVKMKSGKVKMAIVLCSLHEQTQQLDSSHSEQCSPHEQDTVESVHDMNAILNEPKELNEPSDVTDPPDTDPLDELADFFIAESHCRRPNGNYTPERYQRDWVEPLIAIYHAADDDFDQTKWRIAEAIKTLRGAEKQYTIANPGSIQNTAVALRGNGAGLENIGAI